MVCGSAKTPIPERFRAESFCRSRLSLGRVPAMPRPELISDSDLVERRRDLCMCKRYGYRIKRGFPHRPP